MKTIDTCYFCNSGNLHKLYYINKCDISICKNCGLVFCSSYDVPGITDLYHEYNKTEVLGKFERSGRRNYELFRRHVKHFDETDSLLDFGSGLGYFLKNFNVQNNKAGFEISNYQVAHARSHGLTIYNNHVDDLIASGKKFRFITANQVIEHLDDPIGALKKLRTVLTDDGELYLSTGNYRGLTSRITKSRWLVLYPPLHLFYFDPSSLVAILGDAGFTVSTLVTENINLYNILFARKISSENRQEAGAQMQRIKNNGRWSEVAYWIRDRLNGFIRMSGLGDNIILTARKQ